MIWAFGKAAGLSAISFSATLQKDAAAIPNAPCKKKSRSFYSSPLVETSPLWRLIKQKQSRLDPDEIVLMIF